MGEPSHLRASLQLVLRAVRARGGAGGRRGEIPRRRLAVERRGIEIDPGRVEAYRRVTGGGGGSALPLTYPALWETALALELLAAGDFPLPSRGLLHLESELLHLRPLYPDDRPRCRVELDGVEEHPQGLRLTLVSRNWNASGQLCLEDTLVMLARLPDASGSRARREAADARADPAGEWREVESWRLRSNHGRRYARVSGDFNPIHLWSWSSRPFGFRRPILHGFCTQAMVARALVERCLGGDPARLRRLRIFFRSPLPLPARVELRVARKESGSGGYFRLIREEAGKPVAEGEFVGEITDTAVPRASRPESR